MVCIVMMNIWFCSFKEGVYYERSLFRKNMNPQVAILYATVTDTFKRLQKLVEGTDEKELSFKGLKIMKIVLDNYFNI